MKRSAARRKEIRYINQKLADRRRAIKVNIQKDGRLLTTGVKIRNQFMRHLRQKLRKAYRVKNP